jgi:hypothetical protein
MLDPELGGLPCHTALREEQVSADSLMLLCCHYSTFSQVGLSATWLKGLQTDLLRHTLSANRAGLPDSRGFGRNDRNG